MKIAVAAALALAACSTGPSGPEPRLYTIEVLPQPGECHDAWFPRPCLQVREDQDEPFTHMFDSIEGFAFEWGHRYVLEIAEYVVADPPPDGSSRRYELRRILEDQAVPIGTEFVYVAWSGTQSVRRKDAGHVDLFRGVTVPCGSDCEAIGAAIDAEHRFVLTLQHTGNTTTPLELVEWSSCAATVNLTQCDE